jgi:hypothetical protein
MKRGIKGLLGFINGNIHEDEDDGNKVFLHNIR